MLSINTYIFLHLFVSGKHNIDKRGKPITNGVAEKSWLYLDNNAIVCDRHMELAAIVTAINPAISSTSTSNSGNSSNNSDANCDVHFTVSHLQRDLLWQLYDFGHLNKWVVHCFLCTFCGQGKNNCSELKSKGVIL